MSILDRLNMLIRAEVNALGGQERRPAEDARATLREAAESLSTIRRAERALAGRYQDLLDRIDQVEDLAVAALKRGDEAGAREILRDKAELEHEAQRVRSELDHHRVRLDELRAALHALQQRAASARAQRSGHPTPTAGSAPTAYEPLGLADDALDRFQELESRISEMEADFRAEAALDVDPLLDPDGVRIAREFRELETRQALDDAKDTDSALDRLRKAMNPDADD